MNNPIKLLISGADMGGLIAPVPCAMTSMKALGRKIDFISIA